MADSYRPYIAEVRSALIRALCLYDLPSQHVERYQRPEVEFSDSSELLLAPAVITRSDTERCLIEKSANSVRLSIQVSVGWCRFRVQPITTRLQPSAGQLGRQRTVHQLVRPCSRVATACQDAMPRRSDKTTALRRGWSGD